MIVAELFAELASAPSLTNALCEGHAPEFDQPEPGDDPDDTAQRIAFALKACRCCPALAACRAWIDSLPPKQRPAGIIAGLINGKAPTMTTTDHTEDVDLRPLLGEIARQWQRIHPSALTAAEALALLSTLQPITDRLDGTDADDDEAETCEVVPFPKVRADT